MKTEMIFLLKITLHCGNSLCCIFYCATAYFIVLLQHNLYKTEVALRFDMLYTSLGVFLYSVLITPKRRT